MTFSASSCFSIVEEVIRINYDRVSQREEVSYADQSKSEMERRKAKHDPPRCATSHERAALLHVSGHVTWRKHRWLCKPEYSSHVHIKYILYIT